MKTRLILVLLCACYFPLVAQVNFDPYTKKDGLTSSEVTVTLVDSRGIVWIGTSNGLSVYNKAKWHAVKNIEEKQSGKPKLIGRVNVLFEDSKRNIWVGSSEGLFLFNSKYWTAFAKDHEDEFVPKKFMEDRLGRIWITYEYMQVVNATIQMNFALTNGMLHMFDGERWYNFDDIIGGSTAYIQGYSIDYFTSLFQDTKGNIWVSSTEGAFEFDGLNWNLYKKDELKSEKVLSAIEDKEGGIWLALDNGIAQEESDAWKIYNKKDGLAGNRVYKLQRDNSNRIWAFAGNNLNYAGLSFFKDGQWNSYTKNDYKIKDDILSLTINGEDVIAFAETGLAIFSDNEWHKYNKKDGLDEKQFSMIQKNHYGIWLAGESNFYQFKSGQWVSLFNIETRSSVNVIYVENSDNIWLGTERDGIYHYSENKLEHYTIDSGLPDNRILDIFKDKDDEVWVIGKSGVARVLRD